MNDILRELLRKKSRLDSYKPIQKNVLDNLEEWYRIELTYTSNAIEGNTLTRQETALIVEKGITVEGKSVQEHLEAINHAEAFTYIQELAKQKKRNELKLQDILDIHRMILKKIDDADAGRLRNTPVRISGSTTILPNPLRVPYLMGEFIQWLQTTTDNPIQVASDAHFKLVTIHPFVDGNGRTARLLMNFILIQAGFPPAIIKKEERSRYLTSLEMGQTKGQLDSYYELLNDSINRSLDIYLETVIPQEESSQTKQEHIFYTTEEVAKLLQVDPESIRRYVRSGKLKAVKLGGRFIRIEKVDLDT
ncbi:MAG TPA: Fic family protein, partial [Candidatus Saccharimonadales bacterium]|nr:Fic family protein [Candidatus Saccharimonadales bacterium]